jgi:hypothetical protein
MGLTDGHIMYQVYKIKNIYKFTYVQNLCTALNTLNLLESIFIVMRFLLLLYYSYYLI